jgi:hypothetical protein
VAHVFFNLFHRFEILGKNEGLYEKTCILIFFWSRGLKYCRVLVPAGYAHSRQLSNNDLPDMPIPGNYASSFFLVKCFDLRDNQLFFQRLLPEIKTFN